MLAYLFPGQGSQYQGMGRDLFQSSHFSRSLEQQIDAILGYSLKDTCLSGSDKQLSQTDITQPCLYVVNALHHLQCEADGRKPAYLAGHSLGEYNALLAAGVFDLLTGLRLVVRRGQLMAKASGGSMAAVLGLHADDVARALEGNGLTSLDLANFNTPAQVVISGPFKDILQAETAMNKAGATGYIPLQVSAPFHSRYMDAAAKEFETFLKTIEFKELNTTVISNVTARPYPREGRDAVRELLVRQIKSQVLWSPSIGYMKAKGVTEFVEAGPGTTLTRMLQHIPAMPLVDETPPAESNVKATTTAPSPSNTKLTSAAPSPSPMQQQKVLVTPNNVTESAPHVSSGDVAPPVTLSPEVPPATKVTPQKAPSFPPEQVAATFNITPESLGSESFRSQYGLRYAYVAGAMYKGIASKELVAAMGKQRLLSFFGAGGLELKEIEPAIQYIKAAVGDGPYGMNLLHQPGDLEAEERVVDCCLKYDVRNVEASAYMTLTPAVVRYRLTGLGVAPDGSCIRRNRILAKVSRPDIASLFMRPAPERIVKSLVASGKITSAQAELASVTPMADDICVESDSGGHTDGGVALALFPAVLLLRDEILREYDKPPRIHVGAAGGIGTPHAAAAAFIMGADFILTGSINQCTVEAGTSDAAKELLQTIDAQDTAYAPAGDMFEFGAKVQVVRKGGFFHSRANKLYELYTRYNSIDEIDLQTRKRIEGKFFGKTFSDVWAEVVEHYSNSDRSVLSGLEQTPKKKMALIFKWYFAHSGRLAREGREEQKVDYQIYCGPALGAFNRWVKGTSFETWRSRNVADIAELLMKETAELLNNKIYSFAVLSNTYCRSQNKYDP